MSVTPEEPAVIDGQLDIFAELDPATRRRPAVNMEEQQAQIAASIEESTRVLAHSPRSVAVPRESYGILGDLGATVDHLQQVCDQLGQWHSVAAEGGDYAGEDPGGDGSAPATATAQLANAAQSLRTARDAIAAAHTANGRIRWKS